ncbi:MAG: V-type ATP synthase subunit A, partial [Nitrospirota bacterium]
MPGIISKISGPTVVAGSMHNSKMYNLVYVGEEKLIGEVIRIDGSNATIQVYEETTGLSLGDTVIDTGQPLSIELGPGLLTTIFDGVQRPLEEIARSSKGFIPTGVQLPALSRTKKWHFVPVLHRGDVIEEGDVIGTIQETANIIHKVMCPPGLRGIIAEIKNGELSVEDTAVTFEDGSEIKLVQRWPVRKARPFRKKVISGIPFITGQRIIDTLFPIATGGNVIIPGGFGTGKTVLEQTLAKFARTDVIIYVGCGERGNEIAEVLTNFPELRDPYTGSPLMERTVLVVNTSNMPVA